MHEFTITARDGQEYSAHLASSDGHTSLTIDLTDVDDASAGRLPEDEATAVAAIAFLLEHQEAPDLPGRIEIGDLVAAYPDAVDRIVALRH